MAKKGGDDKELTEIDARLAKGMLKRGDNQHHIAAYFGVDSRAINAINKGKKFSKVGVALALELPPPGPYAVDSMYIRFYRSMTKVNQLWEEKNLGEAKELLEKALRNPVFSTDLEESDVISAEMFRDEFGLSNL